MDAVAALFAYLEAKDPSRVRRFVGAGESEIDEVASLAVALGGPPLPSSYRAFLAHLGRDTGGLELGHFESQDDPGIDGILARLRSLKMHGHSLEANRLPFTTGGVDFELEMVVSPRDSEPRLVVCEAQTWPFAPSLRVHLLREAFRTTEVTARPHQCLYWFPTYYTGKPEPWRVRDALRDAGFDPVDDPGFEEMGDEGFCGRRGEVGSRHHATAYARAVESQLVVRLGAAHSSAIASLDAPLGRLGLAKARSA